MQRAPVLFLFLDGVGLGPPDSAVNPLRAAETPTLHRLLEGRSLDADLEPFHGTRASFRPVDATLGVEGTPESATGQTALLTGVNTAKAIGGHYGPKPDARLRPILQRHNLLARFVRSGLRTRLLNAYPESYFEAVRSGRRLHAAIPMAFASAGVPLATEEDLDRGEAVSADFTGRGWQTRLRRRRTPILSPEAAGSRMAKLALDADFTVFDHWLPDYAGHYGEMQGAVRLVTILDRALEGITEGMQGTNLIVLITSDHGNLEDLSIPGHTRNPVPALMSGPLEARIRILDQMKDLTDFAPAMLDHFHITSA
jgi:2,3-bisphosphoglycerate-independent phosphoglycerate mutase